MTEWLRECILPCTNDKKNEIKSTIFLKYWVPHRCQAPFKTLRLKPGTKQRSLFLFLKIVNERINGWNTQYAKWRRALGRKWAREMGRAVPRVRGQSTALDMTTWVSLLEKLTLEQRSERWEKKADEHLGRAIQKTEMGSGKALKWEHAERSKEEQGGQRGGRGVSRERGWRHEGREVTGEQGGRPLQSGRHFKGHVLLEGFVQRDVVLWLMFLF